MAFIPPGTFTMGSPTNELGRYPGEGPLTIVTLTYGFFIGKYEVTQKEYLSLMKTNPSYLKGDLQRPVECVSWSEATNYCGKLTERERQAGRLPLGWSYRLPTEAEWEYACRAGTTTRFSFGDDPDYTNLPNYAWWPANSFFDIPPPGTCCTNWGRSYPGDRLDAAWLALHATNRMPRFHSTRAVGTKLPNAWGLYDMHGNVWELCQDHYGVYPGGHVTNWTGSSVGSDHIDRGGSFYYGPQTAFRSASRGSVGREWYRNCDVGFRIVLVPESL